VIVQRRLEGKDHKGIAKKLDLTKDHILNCARITEKPDHVPQRCSKHWLKAGDRKGGGKRHRVS
jgi:hypothetical protein